MAFAGANPASKVFPSFKNGLSISFVISIKPQVRVIAASMRIMHTCKRNPVLAKIVKSMFIVTVMNQRLSAHCTVLGSLLVVKITHNNMVKSKLKYQKH